MSNATAPDISRSTAVAELQGLYGPFSFSEKLLQQIWQRGDFDAANAMTADGRAVRVLDPGRWNRLGGPDFKDARLCIGGATLTGDVEMHLRAADWAAHGHASDPAYAKVILHVVLFPGQETDTPGASGAIPLLVVLPLLHYSLEEYAADAAVERLANHPLTRIQNSLTQLAPAELRVALKQGAAARWNQKVRFAELRLRRLGWKDACHHAALEILGYRFNRAPMLSIATAFRLPAWKAETSQATMAASFESQQGRWNLQGVRPANHPRRRIGQYARWVAARPNWPDELAAGAAEFFPLCIPDETKTTAEVRRHHGFTAHREKIAETLCVGEMGGTRLDNLVCDGFLPLLAAAGKASPESLASTWFHWFAGDIPERLMALLRNLHMIDGRAWPASHGVAQGLLGRLLAEEGRAEQSPEGAGLDNVSDQKIR